MTSWWGHYEHTGPTLEWCWSYGDRFKNDIPASSWTDRYLGCHSWIGNEFLGATAGTSEGFMSWWGE